MDDEPTWRDGLFLLVCLTAGPLLATLMVVAVARGCWG